MGALPVFIEDLFYFPGWFVGLTGFLFYSYLLIEVGFLKIFYGFNNEKLAEQRIIVDNHRQNRAERGKSSTLGSEFDDIFDADEKQIIVDTLSSGQSEAARTQRSQKPEAKGGLLIEMQSQQQLSRKPS